MTKIDELRNKYLSLCQEKQYNIKFYKDIYINLTVFVEDEQAIWFFNHAYAKKDTPETQAFVNIVENCDFNNSIENIMETKIQKHLDKLNGKFKKFKEECKIYYDQYITDVSDETFYYWLLSEIKLWKESL